MKDFVEGLIIAIDKKIISKSLAFAYLNVYVGEKYGVVFSDETLKKIEENGKFK